MVWTKKESECSFSAVGDSWPTASNSGAITGDNAGLKAHVAFLMLGFFNHFGSALMMSSAHDIVFRQDEAQYRAKDALNETTAVPGNISCNELRCNTLSTATVLLAHVVPSLLVKLAVPHVVHLISSSACIFLCVVLTTQSLLFVALTHVRALSYLGVAFMSVSTSLGEITFLRLTSFFPSSIVTCWSSGTGAAATTAAWMYLFLRKKLPQRDSHLLCLVVPVCLAITYLQFTRSFKLGGQKRMSEHLFNEDEDFERDDSQGDLCSRESPVWRRSKVARLDVLLSKPCAHRKLVKHSVVDTLLIIKPLLKYMLPLFIVYFSEYVINQGLYELMSWRNCIFMDPQEQYRWLQALYQCGVFLSRSSGYLLPIKPIWLLACLQAVNLVVLLLEVSSHIFPSIFVSFGLALYEGLLGGACYVNAFTRIHNEVDAQSREFSMMFTSVADASGIMMAALVSLPIHSQYCKGHFHS